MKILVLSPKSRTIVNFRGDLIREMVSRGHEVLAVGPNTGFEEDIQSLGASFRLLPMKKDSISIKHDIEYICNLCRLFREERPDLVFGYTIKPVIYGSIAARLCGVRQIYPMVTGLGYLFTTESFKAGILRLVAQTLYRIAFRCANRVIFQNPDDMQAILERKLLPKKKCALVNGSGVNMEKFSPAPMPERLTFFMLSRVMRNKGVMEYLQAAQRVKRIYPHVRFKLLGAIEDMADSFKYEEIAEYIEDGSVEHFGELQDVRPQIADCSVYVLPSYREGTPRTVLEAMSMGRPVISTDVPGCRETVIDGETGFLVPVRDVDSLAKRMIWFIENQDRIQQMGQRSHAYCKDKFDVVKVNQRMCEIMRIG